MALETNEEFLSYVYYHSQTDRHLFHTAHILRLLELAGEKPLRDLGEGFLGVDFETAKPLVEKARLRLSKDPAE